MSFLKKLSETVMDTASTIGAKSADLVETGKLKLQRNQLEGSIKDKETEIGELVYLAYKQSTPPDESALTALFAEVKNLENQITALDEKLRKEAAQAAQSAQPAPAAPGRMFCSECGQELSAGAKFCNNCGKAL